MHNIDFKNIEEHITPLNNFPLKWRFADTAYNHLPDKYLNQLQPLDKEASNFISDYIIGTDLHKDIPFKKDFFLRTEHINITQLNKDDVKEWLQQRDLPLDKKVFVSWQPDIAMIVSWNIFMRYIDDFYYPVSDDLIIIDETLTWAFLFAHWEEIYFGIN